MKLRRILGALAVVSVAGGLLAAPAMAATPRTTATITVTDGSSPLAGISVFALNEDQVSDDDESLAGFVSFGDTNTDGQITKSRGNSPLNQLTGGTWTFYLSDSDEDRFAAGTSFAPVEKVVTLTEGVNNLVDLTAPPGNSIEGVAKAPSGRPIKNLDLEPLTKDDESFSGPPFFESPHTSSTGAFLIGGLAPSTYRLLAYRDSEDEDLASTGIKITFAGYGERKTANIKNFKVRCDRGFSLRSSRSGRATVSIRSSASYFGLAKPGGTVKLYRGSRLVKTIAWKGSTKTLTLTGQPRGKKVSYKVAYSGGDCTSWSSTKAVKVKK